MEFTGLELKNLFYEDWTEVNRDDSSYDAEVIHNDIWGWNHSTPPDEYTFVFEYHGDNYIWTVKRLKGDERYNSTTYFDIDLLSDGDLYGVSKAEFVEVEIVTKQWRAVE